MHEGSSGQFKWITDTMVSQQQADAPVLRAVGRGKAAVAVAAKKRICARVKRMNERKIWQIWQAAMALLTSHGPRPI